MRRACMLLLVSGLFIGYVAPVAAAPTAVVQTVGRDQDPKPNPGNVTADQVSQELQDAADALAAVKMADKAGRLMAILALLATVFKLMVSGLRVMGTIGFFVKTDKQSTFIRLFTLVLGGCVFFFSSIVGGMPWWEALFLALSGPMSMIVHEYSKLLRRA